MEREPRTAQELVDEGLEAYRRRDFPRAIACFDDALLLTFEDGDRAAILLRLANAHDELGAYDRALDALRRGLEIDPGSAAAWNNLGVICLRLGRLGDARAAFERALQLDASNVAILVSLGSVSLKQGDPGNALASLQRAVALEPGHPLAHANLALTLAVFGRIEEAEDELRLATLYGLERPEPIQQRIDRLKEHRAAILRETEAKDAGTDAAPASGGGDAA